ncbi:hypothetical protein LWH48_12040 [Halomonas sp. G15]|uniref:hypothetical protein n=1 Tax=Halomonas sp. G15 TaxID=2903521 RepID=UPI001E4B293B|nr:hypothetical protein [Halomonas sp. G15]MCE0733508.1 hypothetical protein [Halomonas sp. G15]
MNEAWITLGMGAFTLLLLGALVMSQLPRMWDSVGGWLFISWIALPAFLVFIAVLVRYPTLLAGVVVALGLYAMRR